MSDTDIVLVLMPYAALERPSLALGVLKAALTQAGIRCQIIHANLLFAETIGLESYECVTKTPSHELAGEWTFAQAAFPDAPGNAEAYFQSIAASLRFMEVMGGGNPARDALLNVRQAAAKHIAQVAEKILALRPRIVGCSSCFQQHCSSLALLRQLRRQAPEIVTLLGGANCEEIMGWTTHQRFDWVDYVFSGEADNALPDLCRRLLNGGKHPPPDQLPPGVFGPAHRQNAIPPDILRAPPTDLAILSTPDFDDYFAALSRSPLRKFVHPGLLAETSRGCWWGDKKKCSFCGLNGEGQPFRRKQPAQILDEFKTLTQRHGLPGLELADNILDMGSFDTWLPALKNSGAPHSLFCEISPNLRRNQLRMLSEAGARWLQPGLECLDDEALRLIGKGTTAAQNIQILKWSREYGLHLLWLFLYDLPGGSDELYQRQADRIRLLVHLQPPFGISHIQYCRFSPYQRTPQKFGLQLAPEPAYSHVYPLPPADLDHLAFFFNDFANPVHQAVRRGDLQKMPPGRRALQHAVTEWQQIWLAYLMPTPACPIPAMLNVRDDGKQLTLLDTRPCLVQRLHKCDGLARVVYLACDRALSLGALQKILCEENQLQADDSVIQAVIDDFLARRVMINLDGHYLSLAVKQPMSPLPDSKLFPGGWVNATIIRKTRDAYENLLRDAAIADTLRRIR
ncbi:MAG: RiPP maturation radical SAM C-methyltransferase [Verrucomicrobiae bacterium]|nr:RiPP maturation radical SAM C-methyltransferase [Verrucomicrobiae bacterium]